MLAALKKARFPVVDELDHLFAPVAFKPRRQSVRIGCISHQVLILGSGDQPFGVNVVAQRVQAHTFEPLPDHFAKLCVQMFIQSQQRLELRI